MPRCGPIRGSGVLDTTDKSIGCSRQEADFELLLDQAIEHCANYTFYAVYQNHDTMSISRSSTTLRIVSDKIISYIILTLYMFLTMSSGDRSCLPGNSEVFRLRPYWVFRWVTPVWSLMDGRPTWSFMAEGLRESWFAHSPLYTPHYQSLFGPCDVTHWRSWTRVTIGACCFTWVLADLSRPRYSEVGRVYPLINLLVRHRIDSRRTEVSNINWANGSWMVKADYHL